MLSDDANYYRHRAADESDRATKACHPKVIAAHRQLAMMYSDRVAELYLPEYSRRDKAVVEPRHGRSQAHTLADTPLARLAFVTDEERAALSRASVGIRYFSPGEELIRQGSAPNHLFFLQTGWAYRHITTRSGARQIPALIVPGGACNLDNLLFERADSGVRALTRAVILALPRKTALELATRHPGVARAFTWLAIGENAILSQWALGLGRRSAQGRLAHLLCELSIRISVKEGGESSFELPLTQELIADVLGLTSVHVNRMMQNLRGAGIIATAGKKMTILDPDRLRTIAEFDPGYLRQIEKSAAARTQALAA